MSTQDDLEKCASDALQQLQRQRADVARQKVLHSEQATDEAPKEDNWVHRADNMRCRTCMYYVPKHTGKVGRCRRSAPTMNGFPAVFPTDWCGDHKLDENKA